MIFTIHKSWKEILKSEIKKDYFKKLEEFVEREYKDSEIFPPKELIFNAFKLCPFEDVKVVILGQDPYHNIEQAHGLCFSVQNGVKVPPSLKNIYKEIMGDIGGDMPDSGNLESWAKQGVLLLNATLTVQAHKAGSHQKKGWEEFTDSVIKRLSEGKENLVFFLWGNYAHKKMSLIDDKKHLVLFAPHPSPLSAYTGFFGCKHFSKANKYLKGKGIGEIKWI